MMLLWMVTYPKKLNGLIVARPAVKTNWPVTAPRIASPARSRKNPERCFTEVCPSDGGWKRRGAVSLIQLIVPRKPVWWAQHQSCYTDLVAGSSPQQQDISARNVMSGHPDTGVFRS